MNNRGKDRSNGKTKKKT